ncbi:MAG TPA: fused MFS/spermidine synthase [Burkholderiales bacterium]|nr:fused MFS/spermidine synthase [Burkholderiales bacterium]
MLLFAATVFTSAFLLFLVQPIIAKQILPWFGGNASVWTVCMVFFQLVLLGGYAYADAVARRLAPRTQAIVHSVLLAASLGFLPILASEAWKPSPDTEPTARILLLLVTTIGLPYFLLSTTGPLVQAWFARAYPSATVYRLFALSNLASLVALVAYPPLIEPAITLQSQSYAWSAVYAVFAALCGTSAWIAARAPAVASVPSAEKIPGDEITETPKTADYLLWLALSTLGSLMLLAVTSHITQNVASVPFIWIVPLVLYLLSFILVFDVGGGRAKSGWYARAWGLPLLFVLLAAMSYELYENLGVMKIRYTIALYCAGLFAACMFCHGELAALRPAPRYLTRFYLMVSIGGAAGGLFVGLVAPRIFHIFLELPIALLACAALAALLTWRTARASPAKLPYAVPAVALALTAVIAWHVIEYVAYINTNALVMTRNFYGTLRVKQYGRGEDPNTTRALVHGVINHGWQYVDPALRREPISYFGPGSGIARALDFYNGRPRRVGIIGLGVGSFTAWGRPGDYFRIYELDPDVVKIAREQFWYLSDARAKIDIVTGDGRLNMERDPPQKFDLISVDAFSSGSIPIHLLTREALQAYRRHLAPGGVIVYNVTNRFVNLAPQLKLVAEAEGMKILLISDDPSEDKYSGTSYVLVTDNPILAADKRFADAEEIAPIKGLETWTDGFNNLFKVVR